MERKFDWVNPPPRWSGDAAALEVKTGAETDWWTETFYGFTHANGHAWVAPVEGAFTLAAEVRGGYEANYDQAGLMLFGPAGTWVKAGIEFTGGETHFSVVVSGPRVGLVDDPAGCVRRGRGAAGAADAVPGRDRGAVRDGRGRLAAGAGRSLARRAGSSRRHVVLAVPRRVPGDVPGYRDRRRAAAGGDGRLRLS